MTSYSLLVRGRAVVLGMIVLTTGCATKQLAGEQADMRQALLSLYESQVLDNLVRIRNDRAILQLDYSRATGTVTHVAGAEASGGVTSTKNTYDTFTPANPTAQSVAFLATRVLQGTFGGKASTSFQSQMAVTADPVIASPEVYQAYLEYLQVDDRLKSVAKGTSPLPKDVHVWEWYEDRFYYVPTAHARDFLKLYLKTTVQRGPVQRSRAFEVTLKSIAAAVPVAGAPNHYTLRLNLSGKIVNGAGEIRVPIGGIEYKFRLKLDPEEEKGALTTHPLLVYSTKDKPGLDVTALAEKLAGQTAEIELDDYVPGSLKTEDLLEGIRSELERLRMQQPVR